MPPVRPVPPVSSGVEVRIDEPVWGYLLAVGLLVTLAGARLLLAMSPFRRFASVIVRMALLAVLVAALAGLSTARRLDALAVVAVIDTSGSVQRFYRTPDGRPGLEEVREFLDAASARRGPDDLLGVVAFDGRAAVLSRPRLGDVPRPDLGVPMAAGTNVAAALDLARSIIPPDANGRIVLFSDGVSTAGRGIADAASGQLPIDTVTLAYDHPAEVVFDSLDGPSTAPAGATVTLRAALSATVPSRGVLRLLREGDVLDITPGEPGDARAVTLQPGENVIRIDLPLPPGRVHRFHAVYEPDIVEGPGGSPVALGDSIAENNQASAFTVTPGGGRVLYVDGRRREASGLPEGPLPAVLREAGAEVDVQPPEGVPLDLLALQAYDLVLLDNVSAEGDPSRHRTLAAYVAELGGGLVMLGGPDAFAPGGWRGTDLEPILPVLLEVPDLLVTSRAATVFVLDNSGSMSWPILGSDASQQDVANDAAALAIRSLDPADLVGVITFNSRARVVVPLGPNDDMPATLARVRAIGSDGGTNLLPGLELARDELRRAAPDATVKHVIVLSDGISRRKERIASLVADMAAEGVKVSTVAVGDGADHHTLRNLAASGGGSYFHAANATQLPRLLLKAVRIVRTPYLREEPFTPALLPTGSPLTVGLGTLPQLHGMVLSRPRTEPSVTLALAAPTGEPVLATWPVGLGQVAAWTSDADVWAREWIADPAFRRLWSQVLRTVARAPDAAGMSAQAEIRDGMLTLRLSAADAENRPLDGLALIANVYAPSGAASTASLAQVGPGQYEGSAPASETGSYIAILKPRLGEKPLPAVIAGTSVPESVEYRARSSDGAALAALAAASGGRVLDLDAPEQADLWSRAGLPPREAVTSHAPTLILAALALLMLDIATRRVAWDRWVSRRFNPDAAPTAEADAARAAAAIRTTADLRAGRRTSSGTPPAIALGDREARDLAMAARDRRAAARLAPTADAPAAPVETRPTPATDSTTDTGLLAAKRRAKGRFDEQAPG